MEKVMASSRRLCPGEDSKGGGMMTACDQIALQVELQKVLKEHGLEEPRTYLFLAFTPNGQPIVVGQMQWSVAKKGVSQLANDWARKQDISLFEKMLLELQPGMSIDSVLAKFQEGNGQGKAHLEEKCVTKAADRIAFRIVAALIKALVRQLRARNSKPVTKWEFPEAPMERGQTQGIRSWLFSKGG